MNIETAMFFGVLTFMTVYLTIIKLPLGMALFVVRHPVWTDILFNVFMGLCIAAVPTIAIISISIVATLTVAGTLWMNTKYRVMEKGLLKKVTNLITDCKVVMADARNQQEFDDALTLKHKLEWTEVELRKAIREVRA